MISTTSLSLIIKELISFRDYSMESVKFDRAIEELKNLIKENNLLKEENEVLKERLKLLESCESHSQVNWRLNCEIFKLSGEVNRLKKMLEDRTNMSK